MLYYNFIFCLFITQRNLSIYLLNNGFLIVIQGTDSIALINICIEIFKKAFVHFSYTVNKAVFTYRMRVNIF